MSRFVAIAKTSDIPPGAREIFEVDGIYIAVFNVDGAYYAIEDVCTHDDGPLVEGDLDEYTITCPRHGACFDIRTGAVLSMPAVIPVPTYDVRVEGDEIQVAIEDKR